MISFLIKSFKRVLYMSIFIMLIIFHAIFFQINGVYTQAASISESVLRLRILANSDEASDQEMKLKLKTEVCRLLQPWLEKCSSKEEAMEWIEQHMDWLREQIDLLSEQILSDQTFSDQTLPKQFYFNQTVSARPDSVQKHPFIRSDSNFIHSDSNCLYHCDVQLTSSLFPTRTYGELTFPPGNYDTLLITLGEGKGQNWWCVLYPSLCFLDEACADFPEESKNQLQDALSEADFEALQEGVTFRFRIAEIMGSFYEQLRSLDLKQYLAIYHTE